MVYNELCHKEIDWGKAMKRILITLTALGMIFIASITTAKNEPYSTTINVSLSPDNKLREKIGLWYCTNPGTDLIGKTTPLTNRSQTKSVDLECESFGFYPLAPKRIIDKYVPPARVGINTLNYIRDSSCELIFNNKTYTLPYGEIVTIPKRNIQSNNNASISCKRLND